MPAIIPCKCRLFTLLLPKMKASIFLNILCLNSLFSSNLFPYLDSLGLILSMVLYQMLIEKLPCLFFLTSCHLFIYNRFLSGAFSLLWHIFLRVFIKNSYLFANSLFRKCLYFSFLLLSINLHSFSITFWKCDFIVLFLSL